MSRFPSNVFQIISLEFLCSCSVTSKWVLEFSTAKYINVNNDFPEVDHTTYKLGTDLLYKPVGPASNET